MRLGPGKHLKGRTLIGGIVKPEQFDYFHEVSPPFFGTTVKSDIHYIWTLVDHQH